VIVFTGDTGPNEALAELAKGADLLVAGTEEFKVRMQQMINDGRWQSMTPDERTGIQRQAAQAHMEPEAVGKMATRASVKTVVLTHLGRYPDYTPLAEEVKKHFSGQVLIAKDLMEF